MDKPELIPVDENLDDQFKPQYDEIELEEFTAQIFKEIDEEDPEEELRRFKKWQKNRAFYRGNQRGFWDEKKRTWVSIDVDSLSPSEASLLVINNQFRPQVKTLAKEFSRSQTRVRANAISDSQRSVLTGRFADALIRHYQPKLMPESVRQIEAKHLILCGNSFRYTYYKKDKKSAQVKAKVGSELKKLDEYSFSACPECGYKQEGKMNKCSECGGVMEFNHVPSTEVESPITGMINAGDPHTEIVDPSEIKVWAGGHSLNDSYYLRRRRFVKTEFITNEFDFFKPQEKTKLSNSAQAQWQFLDTSSPKDSANTFSGLNEFTQVWLDVCKYKRKKLKEDAVFKKKVNGKYVDFTLKKGTLLEDEFPKGMYICRADGTTLTYSKENKNEVWLHTPFDINIDGFWADGLEDSVMNQQIINEYTSLSVENVLYNASPKLIINPSLINPVTVTGRPKDMILMSDNARADKQPKEAFAQINGMNLTSEVSLGIESAKRDMREQTGALLGFNGQGDPNITTATGMSIARDSALALVSTPLAIRAETDEKWCWQIIRIVKENWYDQKYKFLLGKYNDSEADAFRDSKLEEEINLFVEPNSWMPQTNFEKLQNLGAYLTAFGLPMGFLNPQIPQVVRDYAGQLYNVPFDFNELSPDIRIAQRRLDIAKEVAEREIPKAQMPVMALAAAGKQEEGAAILNQVSIIIANAMGVEEDVDEHAVFIDEYKKWLKTDEGQNANPILRDAVKKTMADHRGFMEMQQAMDAQHAIALQGGMSQPQGKSGSGQNNWQQNAPAESSFQVKHGKINDYSENADKSNL